MSTSPPPRNKLPMAPLSASAAARNSIISSSAKGWSPLHINKRDSVSLSPLKPSPELTAHSPSAASPRRTSSSFKHVTKNSLVSSSPFKDLGTAQGAQAAGRELERENVIHERKTARAMGQVPPSAAGVAATPKAIIGLGISATPRGTSRTSSGGSVSHGAAVSGTRKVSNERAKVTFPSPVGVERRSPGGVERKISSSKENESPDVRAGKRVPRNSMNLKSLANREYVSKSPFKRVTSGGELVASKKVAESPVSSPHSIPVHKDDIFTSPSPTVRRVSHDRRRVSPGSLHPGGGGNGSPTPSPPRTSYQPPSLLTTAPPAPSPLSQPPTAVMLLADDVTPTPTPMKSSMTPSRRLRGPRGLVEGPDSPTRGSKTVTFQSVPDVKEFERMSVEGSINGSFEQLDSDENDEWVDDGRDNSFEVILNSPPVLSMTTHKPHPPSRSFNLPTGVAQEEGDQIDDADASTTADFMDALVEEGLFSPPELPTPVIPTVPEVPSESSDEDHPDTFLSTPSLGGSLHPTPLLGDSEFSPPMESTFKFTEKDHSGIPYGRTHHAQRAAIAHSLPPIQSVSPLVQPAIPHAEDHQMLMNANAVNPSLPVLSHPEVGGPHAHQAGLLPDPFITISTATKVLSPANNEREEDGVPLGRTSHLERMQAARALATQSLGLGMPGMPRSPAVPQALEVTKPHVMEPSTPTGFAEALFDASFEMRKGDLLEDKPQDSPSTQERKISEVPEMKGPKRMSVLLDKVERKEEAHKDRDLPRPPKPEPIKLPSPVTRSEDEPVVKKRTSTYGLSAPFSLPLIGATSPLFGGFTSTFTETPEPPPVEPSETPVDEIVRPLTPPRPLNPDGPKVESPHRIPSFDFEDISLDTIDPKPKSSLRPVSLPPPKTASSVPTQRSASDERKMPESLSLSTLPSIPSTGSRSGIDFGSSSDGNGMGTGSAGRIRQRISRDMIKETVQQRLAEGSLSKRHTLPTEESHVLETQSKLGKTNPSQASRDKALPPPPPLIEIDAEEKTPKPERPSLRPRSQTQSAQRILEQNSKDGVIHAPQSALDKLASGVVGDEKIILGPSKIQSTFPVSILQKPKDTAVKVHPPREEVSEIPLIASTAETVKRPEKMETGDRAGPSKVSRRRSRSVSDVTEESDEIVTPRGSILRPRLTLGIRSDRRSMLDAFEEETRDIDSTRKYKIKEKPMVRATYTETFSHTRAGDLDSGRAWRQLRRPSDLNEHAAEIRQMREKEASVGKASGTIFVKVLGIEGLVVPIPDQPTYFCVTLDNGIDYIRTPYSLLSEGARVNQEFSLVEHPNFEFTLSLDVRRDPHILQALHTKPPSSTPIPASPAKHSALRNIFSSPRKAKPAKSESRSTTPLPVLPAPTPQPPVDNIAKYLPTPTSATIAKTHVAFKPIAKNCEAKILEIRYPMFAMFRGEPDRHIGPGQQQAQNAPRKQLAKITLQIFRLPPIPGLRPEELPQCIDDCLRGIRHHAWHEHEYHEGLLTQDGGDCTVPRRRMFRLIGGNLVAMNEVTKKHVASIDLRQAIGVIDLNVSGGSPKSRMTMRRGSDEGISSRPRSFEMEFKDGETIIFSADTDADKVAWMTTLEGLIGKIPSNPLWAELLAAKMREKEFKGKRSGSTSSIGKDTRRSSTKSHVTGRTPSRTKS
ncbi:hypothetical protein TREMEDRAFT_73045 [Tremella mesenterica DSM 1558]|uniref:uncharacterized protein n=1 Tax=Tremella mesenterica (strain ATCC 24925 / CBS 8224 / DSM 1558 / NBRC 9311 / NRRL Y-6157 / RJB 2259-6 / UBC 559-6) TaxID=578456 RepID=UPI0003F4920C|nr:uncharacterized protein TREMEDRAFT_73045 [Tremella mesenterica DSM 1558]EIW73323.1 hypothetical protein TREMEDRAFT_73045 [Tremella mesenterica DSM 1558]